MPDITISLSDDDHRMLSDEYKKMSIDWLRTHPSSLPPPFEQWLASQLVADIRQAMMNKHEVKEMHTINAIEKMITSLQRHGFGLANLTRHGDPEEACTKLAQATASDLGLATHTAKRIQELLAYYSRSAREVADLAHVTMTNRAYGALHEAYRELMERSTKALDHLGEDQAIGRVEGGAAILVSMHVMNRQTAKEKTDAFKLQARNARK